MEYAVMVTARIWKKMALMISIILKEILGDPKTLRDMKYSSM